MNSSLGKDLSQILEEQNVNGADSLMNMPLKVKNGIPLLNKVNGNLPRTEAQKQLMIENAAYHYANFLEALGFDYLADPHSENTPLRVAKAWINDLVKGSVNGLDDITTFPNDEGYSGLICQTKIPIHSLCAHHNLPFFGVCHIAYIPGEEKKDRVLGLSKLNRVAEWHACRPNIQESLTKQIHDKIDELCEGNKGVAVVIESIHCCVKCRGTKNDSVMKTSQLSGHFFDNPSTKQEFFNLIDQSRY